MSEPAENTTLNIQQAADFLGIHKDTLRERAAEGTVRGYKPGRCWRFLQSDLLDYLKTTCPSTKDQAANTGGARPLFTDKQFADRLKKRTSGKRRDLKIV